MVNRPHTISKYVRISSSYMDRPIIHAASRFPNLIMNRLVLNLKSYSDPHSGDVSATLPLSELRFNIVLGNIGAPVEPRQNTRSLIEDDILFDRNGSLQGTVIDPVVSLSFSVFFLLLYIE